MPDSMVSLQKTSTTHQNCNLMFKLIVNKHIPDSQGKQPPKTAPNNPTVAPSPLPYSTQNRTQNVAFCGWVMQRGWFLIGLILGVGISRQSSGPNAATRPKKLTFPNRLGRMLACSKILSVFQSWSKSFLAGNWLVVPWEVSFWFLSTVVRWWGFLSDLD